MLSRPCVLSRHRVLSRSCVLRRHSLSSRRNVSRNVCMTLCGPGKSNFELKDHSKLKPKFEDDPIYVVNLKRYDANNIYKKNLVLQSFALEHRGPNVGTSRYC